MILRTTPLMTASNVGEVVSVEFPFTDSRAGNVGRGLCWQATRATSSSLGSLPGWPGLRDGGTTPPKKSRQGHGWPCRREVAGTGTEQTRFHSGKQGVESNCDAECDAIFGDRVEVLARAVVLVAGMNIPEAAWEAVLARVVAGLTQGAAQS